MLILFWTDLRTFIINLKDYTRLSKNAVEYMLIFCTFWAG